jgi:hypothetical protein
MTGRDDEAGPLPFAAAFWVWADAAKGVVVVVVARQSPRNKTA